MVFTEIKNEAEIHELLYSLGITPNYLCFFQTVYAVYLAANEPEMLQLVTKTLYPEVAKRCRTDSATVERNISAAAKLAWRTSRELLQSFAPQELTQRPKPADFLFLLARQVSGSKIA